MRKSFLIAASLAPLALAACATTPRPDSGFLSSYEGLEARTDTLRVAVRLRGDQGALAGIERVYLEPTVFHPPGQVATDLDEGERLAVLNEVDRQLCYELSERYELVADPAGEDVVRVRAAVTGVEATDRVGSTVSAAASWFIPGPIGIRPGGLGALAAEAEMIVDGEQAAALVWARQANAVGTDTPSLSRVGDALQFAEPFADDAAAVMSAEERSFPGVADPDPCARFGARTQPIGFLARFATGLYVPEVSNGGTAPRSDEER